LVYEKFQKKAWLMLFFSVAWSLWLHRMMWYSSKQPRIMILYLSLLLLISAFG
jgi:hypothetical protein